MHDVPARAQGPGRWWATARAQALAMAVLHGLAVFPLTRSKLPALPTAHPDALTACTGQCGQMGHGVHDASATPERVRELFAAAPWAAGYGIACGRPPHNLFGLDLDRKNGVDGVTNFRQLAARHGFRLPPTAVVETQSGGLHVWLTAPAGVRIPNSASALAQGVDGRGSGGYLVGPGSRGDKGLYAFAQGRGPGQIGAVPEPLLRLLTATQRPSEGPAGVLLSVRLPADQEERLKALEDHVLACGPSDLNNRLYRAARAAFATGLDPDTATARLLAAAVARQHPETPALRTIRSAQRGAARWGLR